MKHLSYKLFSIIFIMILCVKINADDKKFARSYTSYTLPANALELEVWQTGILGKGEGNYSRWEPRMEFEYGITDRLTGSMYFNFSEVKSTNNDYPTEPFTLSTTSFEFRYRLSNPNQWFLDPALYFEIGFGGDKVEYEPKILLTKRFDMFTAAVNLVSEIEKNISEDESESAFELTMGLAYDLNKNFSVGLEFRNDRNYKEIYEKEENQASFIGPTISYHSDKFYFVANFLAQVSGGPIKTNNLDLIGHEKYEIRTILGIGL